MLKVGFKSYSDKIHHSLFVTGFTAIIQQQ